jgi:antiviral defense system Shedu protein SduA
MQVVLEEPRPFHDISSRNEWRRRNRRPDRPRNWHRKPRYSAWGIKAWHKGWGLNPFSGWGLCIAETPVQVSQNKIYSIHPELSGGIVQVRNQITVAVEHFSKTLGAGFDGLNRVHPKGVLITGTLSSLSAREQDSFNHFRQGLFSLTVITYDEVLRRLKILFDHELPTSGKEADE